MLAASATALAAGAALEALPPLGAEEEQPQEDVCYICLGEGTIEVRGSGVPQGSGRAG